MFKAIKAFLQYLAAPPHIKQSIRRPQEGINQRMEAGLCVYGVVHEHTVCNHCQTGRVEIFTFINNHFNSAMTAHGSEMTAGAAV